MFLLSLILFFAALLPAARADEAGDFFLHNGDTVVFYGDSITEQQHYTRDIETYVLTRFPDWHVKFINSGWNGDRVTGGEGGTIETRLTRDVLAYHPTVVTILLGMNDAAYTRFDQLTYLTYVQGLTRIVDTLQRQSPGVRLTLLTPTMYDEKAVGSRHFHGYNDVLLRYGEFVKKLGADRSIPVVDLNASMMAVTHTGRLRDPKFTLCWDGVHPNETGQLLMASWILRAWHAPSQGTDLTLDPAHPVSLVTTLPWPIPDRAREAFTVSPLPRMLNAIRVHASGVTADRYDLLVDNKAVATVTRAELEQGLDLTAFPTLPLNEQSARVVGMVQDRLDMWRYLWKGGPNAIAHRGDKPDATELAALSAIDHWLDERRDSASEAAQPQTHTYALRPALGQFALRQSFPSFLLHHPPPAHHAVLLKKQN